jgi:hypothetical protein
MQVHFSVTTPLVQTSPGGVVARQAGGRDISQPAARLTFLAPGTTEMPSCFFAASLDDTRLIFHGTLVKM